MMDGVQLSWWFIGAYLALMLGVGVWFRRRVRSVEDMAVAGRNSGVWLIAFSVAATWINGDDADRDLRAGGGLRPRRLLERRLVHAGDDLDLVLHHPPAVGDGG